MSSQLGLARLWLGVAGLWAGVLVGWLLLDRGNKSSSTSCWDTIPKITIFGDSLTARAYEPQGWGAALQNFYKNRAMVQPAGFGGFNTRMAVAMLDTLLPQGSKHMLVVVWFGANDAALPTERVAIPKAEYADNLRRILERATSIAEHTVVITTPPVDAAGRLEYQKRKYGDKATGTLERTPAQADAFREAAADIFGGGGPAGCNAVDYAGRASVLNPWAAMQLQPGWGARFLSDGLHFTGEGQAFVFAQLESHLRAAAPHLLPEVLAPQYDLVQDVDAEAPVLVPRDR